MTVITRFPPSPTGYFHIGSARTALFNYLFARHHGGKLLLRFEDTDRERSKAAYETDITDGLHWLGIEYDNEPVRQSERTDLHRKYLETLLEKNAAYEAEETTKGDGNVIRFRNPKKDIVFHDEIRGDIRFDTTDLGDFVIAKNHNEPLYHLAVVVDDEEMGVTHVIRGEEHISNTPRQILIMEALGVERPVYAHIPLVHAPDHSKLSKRHGALSVNEYRELGYIPEALLNFIALLGWHPKDETEILSKEELIQRFELSDVQKGAAIFDVEKLKWMNRQYLKQLSDADIAVHLSQTIPEALVGEGSGERLLAIAPLVRERIATLADIPSLVRTGEFTWAFTAPRYDSADLLWKEDPSREKTAERLGRVRDMLVTIPDNNFSAESIKDAVWDYATAEGRGGVLWPLRFALSGKEKSPDPFIIAAIIGKNETIARLEHALRALTDK